jgi:hypothetical protein
MSQFNGRALAFVSTLICIWISARIVIYEPVKQDLTPLAIANKSSLQRKIVSTFEIAEKSWRPYRVGAKAKRPFDLVLRQPSFSVHNAAPYRLPLSSSSSRFWHSNKNTIPKTPHSLHLTNASTAISLAAPILNLPIPNEMVGLPLGPRQRLRVQNYAYSFWRLGTSDNGIISSGEFGDSQTGFIYEIPVRFGKSSSSNTAILLRGSFEPGNIDQREFGIGLRWRPARNLPVAVSLEQRIAANGQYRTVAYTSASTPPIKLGKRVKMISYAQLGISKSRDLLAFADIQARVDYPVLEATKAKIYLAPIAALNVQNSRYRLEIGPSISTNFSIRDAHLRLSADWRTQIAGDMRRGSGPTMTISSSF